MRFSISDADTTLVCVRGQFGSPGAHVAAPSGVRKSVPPMLPRSWSPVFIEWYRSSARSVTRTELCVGIHAVGVEAHGQGAIRSPSGSACEQNRRSRTWWTSRSIANSAARVCGALRCWSGALNGVLLTAFGAADARSSRSVGLEGAARRGRGCGADPE